MTPLVVSITGFRDNQPAEIPAIRSLLDNELNRRGMLAVHSIANTIFPYSLWDQTAPADVAARRLFERYHRLLPALRRRDQRNRHGTYFQRIISYAPLHQTDDSAMNQLEYLLTTWRRGNHRRSALQLSVFDPTRDHTNQRQRGFPCLQQLALTPYGTSRRRLSLTAFYATQYCFDKAYGNYLGLCRLGEFICHQLGFSLRRVTCIAALASLGGIHVSAASQFRRAIQGLLEPEPTSTD